MARIIVDGDACNCIDEIINNARETGDEVHLFCDTNHDFSKWRNRAEIHYVDAGRDAVDYAILKFAKPQQKDLVVTNDTGLAAMVRVMNVSCRSFSGFFYSKDSIDRGLQARYLRSAEGNKNKKAKHRRSNGFDRFRKPEPAFAF